MIAVAPITLEVNGVRLEPLAPHHADGLRAAASDGELWNLVVTMQGEWPRVKAQLEACLAHHAKG